ncbi:MAG: metallophosphoesterase, partial [Clostridia bacterium]|nr:metallophosphoesterase [Clostridia bacterium]
MAIYALADLHLSFGTDKPMDIFGEAWGDYTEKIKTNWHSVVTNQDLVIIPGDVSWATYLEDTYNDFKFINELPGNKVILKGNHDYWWTTLSKMEKFLNENSFDTIKILNNT